MLQHEVVILLCIGTARSRLARTRAPKMDGASSTVAQNESSQCLRLREKGFTSTSLVYGRRLWSVLFFENLTLTASLYPSTCLGSSPPRRQQAVQASCEYAFFWYWHFRALWELLSSFMCMFSVSFSASQIMLTQNQRKHIEHANWKWPFRFINREQSFRCQNPGTEFGRLVWFNKPAIW